MATGRAIPAAPGDAASDPAAAPDPASAPGHVDHADHADHADPAASLLGRRGFLRDLAGGGAAIAVVGWLPAGRGYTSRQGLAALTEKEFAVVVAATEALMADAPVAPEKVAADIDRALARIGNPILADVQTVLALLEHLTFLGGRLSRFTSLDPPSRLAYLEGWATSRFNLRRAAYHAIRTLVHFFGWARPETRALTGFRGPWPERYDYPAYPIDFGGVT